MQDLEGKVAVITGAGSGLGRAMAHRFGEAGMRLVLSDINEGRLNQIGGQLDARGVEVQTLVSDVAKLSQVEALADLAFERFGAVNLLCNNAGVAAVGAAWECTHADWEWAIGVNLWGVIHGVRAFVPRMLESGEPGHIVNTASVAGILAPPMSSPYVATKHAVVGMTESLFHDLKLRQSALSCSVLAPGFVRTRIATSETERPGALRNPGGADVSCSRDVSQYYAKSVAAGSSPRKVADAVVDAVLDDRFYILTHPQMQPAIEDRFGRLLEGQNPKTRPLTLSMKDEG